MRGADISQPSLFTTGTVSDFVPPNRPLCGIRKLIEIQSITHQQPDIPAHRMRQKMREMLPQDIKQQAKTERWSYR